MKTILQYSAILLMSCFCFLSGKTYLFGRYEDPLDLDLHTAYFK